MSTNVRRMDYTVNTQNMDTILDGVRTVARFVVPEWNNNNSNNNDNCNNNSVSDADIDIHQFKAGLTNLLFRVRGKRSNGELFTFLIRIDGEGTDAFLNRNLETEIQCFLSDFRMAASVYCLFRNGRSYEYIQGRSLEPIELAAEPFKSLIPIHMARYHSVGISVKQDNGQCSTTYSDNILKVFSNDIIKDSNNNIINNNTSKHVISGIFPLFESWIDLLPDKFNTAEKTEKFQKFLPQGKSMLLKEIHFLKKVAEQQNNLNLTFTHNDLLSGNVLYDADTGAIHFIDLEYGRFHYNASDIANHFCEYKGFELDNSKYPTMETQRIFVEIYLKEFHKIHNLPNPTEQQITEFLDGVQLFVPFADALWGTWGFLQAHLSSIDFDYMDYAITRWKYYFDAKPTTYKKYL